MIPWSPLHGGLLSGAIRKERESSGVRTTKGRSGEGLEANRPALEAYEALCAEIGEDPADVGLAWLLSREGVTAPIVGPRTQAQLDGALHAVEISLSQETLDRLDEIFPAPGPNGSKPAPEAYAW